MFAVLDIPAIEMELQEIGVSAAELCRVAGIDQSTWQRWKAGEFEPRQDKARAVITALSLVRQQANPNP